MPRNKQTNDQPQQLAPSKKVLRSRRAKSAKTLRAQLTALGTPSIHRYLGGAWKMHLPFAYDLVRELRPRIFVELGVYQGESYFAFCQSVQENGLATKCYGVDTWRGDIHAGVYGPEVGNEVVAYNGGYSGFSHLMAMTFKEAAGEFADRSIDLLHIDGAHRYEDVKEDFETWLPKLSKNGIVLFHDVLVQDRGFGVNKLWEEIARPRASFLFEFGYGLGVWKKSPISKNGLPFLRALFLADSEEKRVINNHYMATATAVESSATAEPNQSAPEDGKIAMVVYSAETGGYSEGRSTHVTYAAQRWSHLDIALDRGLGTEPLRVDPLTAIGLVDIAAITIRSAISGEILWRANGDGGLEALQISGSAVRIPHPHLARVLSYGEDPQIYLPAFSGGEFDGPLRLELWLKTETGFDSIRKGISELANMSSHSLVTTAQTRALLESSNRACSDKEAEILSLRVELEKAVREHGDALARSSGELANRVSELTKSRQELALAKNELTVLVSELDQSRAELETKNAELTFRNCEVQRVLREFESQTSSHLDPARNELAPTGSQLLEFVKEWSSLKKRLVEERAELVHELGLAREKVSSLNHQLAEIKGSPLWRYTDRFRKLRGRDLATKVVESSADGTSLREEALPCSFWVDSPSEPSVEGQRVIVSGWVLAPVGEKIYGVRALVNDGIFIGQYGFGREDVAAAFNDRSDATRPGFRISLDTTLPVGIHEVALQVITTECWKTFCVHRHEVQQVTGDQNIDRLEGDAKDFTKVAAVSREKSPGNAIPAREGIDFEGTLESPPDEVTNEHGLLLVMGWLYLRTKKMAALSAGLNGGEGAPLAHSLPRLDVAKHLPQFPSAIDSGFEGYLPIEIGFSGRRRLEIQAVLTDGTRLRCFYRDLMVKVPEPARHVVPPIDPSDDDRYARWIKTNRLTSYLLKRMTRDASRVAQTGPQISIIVPVFNTPASYLEALIESVRGQLYPNWQLCLADDASTQPHVRPILERAATADSRIGVLFQDSNGHVVKTSNSALALAKGDYVGLLDHDDLLTPDALLHVAEAVVLERALDVLYTDEDKLSPEGKRYDPIFKGSFSPEMSLTHNYIQHFTVIRRSLLQEVGGFREGFEGAQDLDLYLRVLEKTTPERVRHLPFVCYHWRSHPESTASSGAQKSYVFDSARKSIAEALTRRRIRAVPFLPEWAKEANCCLYQLKWSPDLLRENPVTIVIPTKNRSDLLQKCLASLERTVDAAHVNVIIVDDFSEEESTRNYLKQLGSRTRLRCRVIQPRPRSAEFNFAQLINEGVAAADTALVLLLNNDTEALDAGWLEEMVGWMSIKDVGAVGAKLIYPDDTIQHAGVIVGSHGGLAEHIFHRLPIDVIGFNFLTHAARNVSAVTGACMLTSKAAFDEVGGFDQDNLGMEYNDVDFCLRLRSAKKRIVFTPQARLLHRCAQSRGEEWRPKEHLNFLRRYGSAQDAFYNESLDPNRMPVAVNPDHFLHKARVGKLKVLMISHNLNLEGATKILFERAEYFASDRGYKVTVVSRMDGPLRQDYETAGIPVFIAKETSPYIEEKVIAYKNRLRKIGNELDAESFDLVICNTLSCFWGVLLANIFKLPVIWGIHESTTIDQFFHFDFVPDGLVESCLASADRIVFEANATRQLFRQYESCNNFITIPGSVDVEAINRFSEQRSQRSLRVKHGVDPDKIVVALIGTTCPRKGQHVFIQAIARLQAKWPNDIAKISFLMVGGRESLYLDLLRAQLDTIRGTDTQIIEERADVYDFFRLADIFVCASFQESFPRVILEAMAFKLPIISTDVFGVPEIVENHGEGLLIPAGDPQRLAETTEVLIQAPRIREELGARGHAKVTRLFNSETQLRKHLELTRQVVAQHV